MNRNELHEHQNNTRQPRAGWNLEGDTMSKRNFRAWDADDEPKKPYIPNLPKKHRRNLSTELLDRAESNRLSGRRTTFIDLEAYAKRARELEQSLNEFVRFAWATGCFPKWETARKAITGKAKR